MAGITSPRADLAGFLNECVARQSRVDAMLVVVVPEFPQLPLQISSVPK
jgi:hypothetical protein